MRTYRFHISIDSNSEVVKDRTVEDMGWTEEEWECLSSMDQNGELQSEYEKILDNIVSVKWEEIS